MIHIDGLTTRQVQLMDLLWTCNDMEQIKRFISALPTKQDQLDARSLVLVATWESIEQELGLTQEHKDAATRAIANAMR
jgi:hypothetical protein